MPRWKKQRLGLPLYDCFIHLMKIDLHCHSRYSHDNYLEPEDLIAAAIDRGLDGVCFTEHYSVEASREVENIKVPRGFFVFRGVEIATAWGHLLAFGLRDDRWNRWGRDNYLDAREVIESVHSLGGICVPAHPFRSFASFGNRLAQLDGLDAVETHNGSNSVSENNLARDFARQRGLVSVGGSDCHRKDQVGRAFTRFDQPVTSIAEIVAQIRQGRCRGVCHEKTTKL
ncbi:MAG: CehA/McbA family metallohydrolase [Desulfobacterales bacterium]|jgi:predicted metal-dependent phosphoesterase TrpH|nr:CehA/McbA family metallohydrolase [Desulfobacterales bacterium]